MYKHIIISICLILFFIGNVKAEEIIINSPKGDIRIRIAPSDEKLIELKDRLTRPEGVMQRMRYDIRNMRNDYIQAIASTTIRVEAMAVLDEMEDLSELLYIFTEDAYFTIDRLEMEIHRLELQIDRLEMQIKIEESEGSSDWDTASPLTMETFGYLMIKLEKESFDSAKLDLLRVSVRNNYFTIAQLCEIIGLFTFDKEKVESIRIIYPKVIDKENNFKLLSKVTFSSSKEQIKEIIR